MKTTNCRLSATTIVNAFAEQTDRLIAEAEKGSTAERYDVSAKQIETLIRHAVYKRGLRSRADFRARKQSMPDLVMTVDGVRGNAEIKTGGTVGTPIDGEWSEDDIMPRAHYIVFPVIDIMHSERDIYNYSAVMLRADFLALCAECSRKGLRGVFHVGGGMSKNGKYRTPIIVFRETPLFKLRRAVENGIKNGIYHTIAEYVTD